MEANLPLFFLISNTATALNPHKIRINKPQRCMPKCPYGSLYYWSFNKIILTILLFRNCYILYFWKFLLSSPVFFHHTLLYDTFSKQCNCLFRTSVNTAITHCAFIPCCGTFPLFIFSTACVQNTRFFSANAT